MGNSNIRYENCEHDEFLKNHIAGIMMLKNSVMSPQEARAVQGKFNTFSTEKDLVGMTHADFDKLRREEKQMKADMLITLPYTKKPATVEKRDATFTLRDFARNLPSFENGYVSYVAPFYIENYWFDLGTPQEYDWDCCSICRLNDDTILFCENSEFGTGYVHRRCKYCHELEHINQHIKKWKDAKKAARSPFVKLMNKLGDIFRALTRWISSSRLGDREFFADTMIMVMLILWVSIILHVGGIF